MAPRSWQTVTVWVPHGKRERLLRLVKRQNRKQLYQDYVGMEFLVMITGLCDTSHKPQITSYSTTQQDPEDWTNNPLPDPVLVCALLLGLDLQQNSGLTGVKSRHHHDGKTSVRCRF
jgi:hypothetical protein